MTIASLRRSSRRALLLAALLAACSDSTHVTDVPETGSPDRPQNGLVAVAESALSATVEGRDLAVTIPLERVAAKAVDTRLTVVLTEVGASEPLDSFEVQVKLGAREDRTSVMAHLELPRALSAQADLVGYSVRIHDGTSEGLSVTRSAFAMLPRYEVRLEGPARVSADKSVSYRVRAHDPKSFAPVAGAKVSLTLTREGEAPRELTGTTDERGDAFFALSLAEAGDYAVSAAAENAGTLATLSQTVSVESGSSRLLLTTDKPIYQPGQLVHLRALTLAKGSNEPVANTAAVFEIKDGKGNKVFKKRVVSDGFGIAATTFRLGSVLNMGTFGASVSVGDIVAQKTFDVSRYTLPKFAVDVDVDRAWYEAGQTVQGTLDARYFFGKDVAQADVEITGATLDVGENVFGRVLGKTRADGVFPFSLTLPATLAGLPLEQGKALVTLHAKVTDTAGQVVEKDAALVVADAPAQAVVVPEAGSLVPGVENRLVAFVGDPVGAPIASARVALRGAGQVACDTDAFGQCALLLTPDPNAAYDVELRVGGELVSTTPLSLPTQPGAEHVLVRTDRAVYDVGDTLEVELVTSAGDGRVYVDWLHEGQAVDQRTLQADDGKASFEVTLDATHAGNNRIEAYVVEAGGNVVRAGSTLFVREGGALRVSLETDKSTYAPGEPASLTFSVTDENGAPKVSALGVQIVDEAVFALVEATPGLLRTYFELDDAFATPHYQIAAPAGSLASLVFEDTEASEPAAREAAQTRARAAFAALGDMGVTGLHAGSWSTTMARVKELLTPSYQRETVALQKTVDALVKRATNELAWQGCTAERYDCGELGYFGSALVEKVRSGFAAFDLWGRAYRIDGDWELRATSAGPNEVEGDDDDQSFVLSLPYANDGEPSAGGEEPPVDDDSAGDGASGGGDGTPSEGDDGPRVRRDFPETLYVNPAIITGPDGKATVEVPLADSITEWRVSSMANARDGRLGGAAHGITVFQDFFVDVAFPATLTRGDQVSFPIALYNYLDTPQSVTVTLKGDSWYTAVGATSATVELGAGAVKGVSFPVRVNEVGAHTLTVEAIGSARSDAVERAVRVVPDGKEVPSAQSGALGAGQKTLAASFPANAVPGSGALHLTVYPAFLSSAVAGMDSILAEPSGCFEQTTSTTWPNVLVLRYMRDTQQITPEIELKAEALISAGYQRLLTFEHPTGGFSWFGVSDGHPYLSVTAFGIMEFADMAQAVDIDDAMVARTVRWLADQQKGDGTWEGDQTEFFSFHTNQVRNTAFTLWALASAGHQGPEMERGLSYLRAHHDDDQQDGYTLALVANAFAAIAPNDAVLTQTLASLDALKHEEDGKVSWDAGDTQTDFYGSGNDAAVTATALVAHALLTADRSPELAQKAIAYLSEARDANGNFGSTQATIWTLRTLLLAARKGTSGAVGTLDVLVDGAPFATLALTEDQSDVMTTVDLAQVATTGDHEVQLSFAGTGKVSYNLVESYHVPWSEVPVENDGPLAVHVSYDRTTFSVDETVGATVRVDNLTDATVYMTLVDVGIPPGFAVETDDLDAAITAGTLSRYEVTPRQLILYVTQIPASDSVSFAYRLRATMPVKASDGGARVFPYYEPDRESHAAATTITAQ